MVNNWTKIPLWSKSLPIKPKENLQSHIFINKKPFKASFQKYPCDLHPSMALILSGEYGRIYQRERCEYALRNYNTKRNQAVTINSQIMKRYKDWLAKFNANKDCIKKYCCNIGFR